jgi:hypothetical protein
MEAEMEDMSGEKKLMRLYISDQKDKLKAYTRELKDKEQIIRDVNRMIKNIQIDIHSVSEHYQNPPKLKDAVKVS